MGLVDILRVLFYACILINSANSNGQLFIGFLGYSNPQNLDYNGKCCDVKGSSGECNDMCDLIFNVSVYGLNSSLQLSPSDKPIDNNSTEKFPTDKEHLNINNPLMLAFSHWPVSIEKFPTDKEHLNINNPLMLAISHWPVSIEKFPTDKVHLNINNSLMLAFNTWPGQVNIAVDVYDQDESSLEVVDKFVFSFKKESPSLQYAFMEGIGNRTLLPSKLRMIFRYECVKGNLDGNYCFNKECDLYPSDKECPDIRPQGNESVTTDWVISFNSTTESTLSTECGRIEIPNLRSLINCTETTIDPTTEATIDETTSYTTEDINHESSTVELLPLTTERSVTTMQMETSVSKSTHSNDITTHSSETTTHSSETTTHFSEIRTHFSDIPTDSSNTTTHSTDQTTTEKEHSNKITTAARFSDNPTSAMNEQTTSNNKPEITTIELKPSSMKQTSTYNAKLSSMNNRNVPTNEPINRQGTTSPKPVTNSTTVAELPTTIRDVNDDPMKYWPGIVGGVLGAIVVVALVSYIIYIRRKRLRKSNNDIYNVNPKRWVLEAPEENGTSGKSEIALETEPV